jgi:hypothetical protein
MAKTYALEVDSGGIPVPQYENTGATDTEAWQGTNGGGFVTGDEAHDAADAGNPVKIGGKAVDPTSLPSAVTAADRVNALFDLYGRLFVRGDYTSGDIAHDAADSGNPLKLGAKASTLKPAAVSNGDRVNLWSDEYGQLHIILETGTNSIGSVDTELPAAAVLADGTANPTSPMVGANEQLFNGTTWDRKRGNLQGALLASAARTETQTGADQTNYNGRGIHVVLNVTAHSDTPSIVLKIEGKSASGIYYTLLEGAAVTGEGTHVYKVMPWATPVANEAAADLLPRTWRVVVTHADADSITYSVDYAIDN